jgi:nitroreductase
MRRRSFLTHTGILTIMVAGGHVWRTFGQAVPEIGEGPAFEPWRTWRADSHEGPLALIHAAILSANAFNSQPWLFKVTASRIELYADIKRNLGAFDPYLRELHLSLGCAVENLTVAARPNGYKCSLTMLPGKLAVAPAKQEPGVVAQVDLAPATRIRDELFNAIPHRHTNRNPFDIKKEVPEQFVRKLIQVIGDDDEVKLFLFTTKAQRESITDIIWDASRKLSSDSDVSHGTEPWYRTTMDQMQKLRDGVYVGEPEPNAAPVQPMSYVELMRTGRVFGLIAVRDRYDRPQTISAGRVWQRAHLLATVHGLAARPANGAVELIDHERRLKREAQSAARLSEITGDAAWQPTFMFYMGYPTQPASASPRRSVQSVVISKPSTTSR